MTDRQHLFWKVKRMKQNETTENEVIERLIATAEECHHFSRKKAEKFAKEARALQKNLLLRKKQKQARENKKNQD